MIDQSWALLFNSGLWFNTRTIFLKNSFKFEFFFVSILNQIITPAWTQKGAYLISTYVEMIMLNFLGGLEEILIKFSWRNHQNCTDRSWDWTRPFLDFFEDAFLMQLKSNVQYGVSHRGRNLWFLYLCWEKCAVALVVGRRIIVVTNKRGRQVMTIAGGNWWPLFVNVSC